MGLFSVTLTMCRLMGAILSLPPLPRLLPPKLLVQRQRALLGQQLRPLQRTALLAEQRT